MSWSTLLRIVSRQFLNIVSEEDSTASLYNLIQCSVTYTVKKFFLVLRWNFLSISFYLMLVVPISGTTERSLAPSF